MSSRYHIDATVKTPEITVDTEKGEVVMRGRSLPEDSITFYEPAIKVMQDAFLIRKSFKLFFYIEYLNTSSSSVIRSILEMFAEKGRTGEIDFVVLWHYEEDDLEMEEMGRHYQQTVDDLPIEFLEVDAI